MFADMTDSDTPALSAVVVVRVAAATVREESRSVRRILQGARVPARRLHFLHRLPRISLLVRGSFLAPKAVLSAGAVGTGDASMLTMTVCMT